MNSLSSCQLKFIVRLVGKSRYRLVECALHNLGGTVAIVTLRFAGIFYFYKGEAMKEKINEFLKRAKEKLRSCDTIKTLNELKVKFLGKQGELTSFLRGMKDVPTEQLNESIKKYIPMILSNSSAKQINKNERVLKESRKPTILTGENKQNKVAMGFDEIDSDVDAEISKIIENSKFNY